MRGLFILLISISSFLSGFSQHQSESNLINQIFKDYNVGKCKYIDTILILPHPIYEIPRTESNFNRIKDYYKNFKRSTYEDFIDNLDKEIVLPDPDTPDTPFIIDQAIYNDYSEVFSKHRNILIIEFSNIGFSEDKLQALVYYGTIQGPMSAGGIYLVYERKRAKWKLKATLGAWAA